MSATDSGPNPDQAETPDAAPTVARRLLLFGIIAPLIGLSIGVDGGDIFQILAIDNLDLDPRAIGIALGLGTLSIPIQIWAAKIPIERARSNVRLHLWIMGVMALIVAALIAFAEPGSPIVFLALVIAVLAEISVSVLMATSWQPVINYTLSTKQRQFLIGPGNALKGLALLLSVVIFGLLGQTGRALFMLVVGLVAISIGWSLHVLPPPRSTTGLAAVPAKGGVADFRSNVAIRNLFITLPAIAFAYWPLMLSYVALVLWPTVNLGILGASLALGGIIAAALWRDPGTSLIIVIKASAVVLAGCSVLIALIGRDVSTRTGIGLLAIITFGSAARSVMSIGIGELAQRRIDETNAVAVMTVFDVIASTSFQLGFFVAGFLVAASERSSSALNPYQLWLIVTALLLVTAILRLRDRSVSTG